MWYLLAYFYVISLSPLLLRVERVHLLLIVGCLVVSVLVGSWQHLLGLSGLSQAYSRNWLLMGVPFFLIGWQIRKHPIQKYCSDVLLGGSVVIFAALSIVEANYLAPFHNHGDMLICTAPLAVALFAFCLKHPNKGVTWADEIGKKYSQWIYVYQLLIVILVSTYMLPTEGMQAGTFWWTFPLVFFSSLLLSVITKRVKWLR